MIRETPDEASQPVRVRLDAPQLTGVLRIVLMLVTTAFALYLVWRNVESEIAAAEEAERKTKHEARKQLIETRRAQSKAAVDAKLDELKAKRPRRQKAAV